MILTERIEQRLELEDVSVAHNVTYTPAGNEMNNYIVNKHGIVLQYALPADEEDEGVIEDFLEYIEATVAEIE